MRLWPPLKTVEHRPVPESAHDGAFDVFIEHLAVPHRASRAFWHLVLSGSAALPAVRGGLQHESADVRHYCVKALDHIVDEDAFPALIAMLGDPDRRVRYEALHALACDRCKETTCRPSKFDVLPLAIRLLRHDPDDHVRAMACEVVGRWVHSDPVAEAALIEVQSEDRSPAVRKKAAWHAPGGTIYEKTKPRVPRG
jgi:hypothetical protein